MNKTNLSPVLINSQSVGSGILAVKAKQKTIITTILTIALIILFVVTHHLFIGIAAALAGRVTYKNFQNFRFSTIEFNRERAIEQFKTLAEELVLNPTVYSDFYSSGKPDFKPREARNIDEGAKYVAERQPIKDFLAKDPSDPFRKLVAEKVAISAKFDIFDETHKELIVPNNKALQWFAKKYCKKYKIIIAVPPEIEVTATNHKIFDVAGFVNKLQDRIAEPLYMGMICNDWKGPHMIPLLLYFDGKNREKNAVIILDSTGNDYGLKDKFVKQCKFAEHNIFWTLGVRQADTLSCRTGAKGRKDTQRVAKIES